MITIGITTYNRLSLAKIMARSLYRSDLSVPHQIRIYDDCSTDYDINSLKEIFPNAALVSRSETNFRSDGNIHRMYKDFLTTSDEYFFNADSDLLFCKDWLQLGLKYIKETDGILTLFNANSHPAKEFLNEKFCIKERIGSAGTLFTRSRVEEIIKQFPDKIKSFDWEWCQYFNKNNIRIFCVNNSLVQHIGYHGQNTTISYKGYKKIKTTKPYFDYGKNFKIDSAETGQIINDIFEKFVEQNRMEDERIFRLLSQRPISRIKHIIKKLLNYKDK